MFTMLHKYVNKLEKCLVVEKKYIQKVKLGNMFMQLAVNGLKHVN